MVRQEELKTMPFGEVWDEYCRSCNVPVGTDWFETVQKIRSHTRRAFEARVIPQISL